MKFGHKYYISLAILLSTVAVFGFGHIAYGNHPNVARSVSEVNDVKLTKATDYILPLKGASVRGGHTLLCTPNRRLRVTFQLLAAHLKGISSNDGNPTRPLSKSRTYPAPYMTSPIGHT